MMHIYLELLLFMPLYFKLDMKWLIVSHARHWYFSYVRCSLVDLVLGHLTSTAIIWMTTFAAEKVCSSFAASFSLRHMKKICQYTAPIIDFDILPIIENIIENKEASRAVPVDIWDNHQHDDNSLINTDFFVYVCIWLCWLSMLLLESWNMGNFWRPEFFCGI